MADAIYGRIQLLLTDHEAQVVLSAVERELRRLVYDVEFSTAADNKHRADCDDACESIITALRSELSHREQEKC